MYKKTKGIILKKKKIGEGDELLTIYTADLGKIEAFAKGIRKINSKRGGHLDLLMLSSLNLYINRQSRYFIREASSINNFENIRNYLNKTLWGYYLIETIDKSTSYEEASPATFNLLKKALFILNATQESSLTNLVDLFKLKLIIILGFRPKLNYCLECHRRPEEIEKLFFEIDEGGIICSNCFGPYRSDAISLTISEIKLFRKLIQLPLEQFFLIEPKSITKIKRIIDLFLNRITERKIYSKDIIKRLHSWLPPN